MNHWSFVAAAYAIAAAVLVGYWWRVERRIGTLEAEAESRQRS
ncbi:MAG: heme exporter protein CcmD [Candidatus Rokuibacteriota bacterium]